MPSVAIAAPPRTIQAGSLFLLCNIHIYISMCIYKIKHRVHWLVIEESLLCVSAGFKGSRSTNRVCFDSRVLEARLIVQGSLVHVARRRARRSLVLRAGLAAELIVVLEAAQAGLIH